MKRIFTIATLILAAALTSCVTPETGDKQLDALTSYMDLQDVPGVYTYANEQGKSTYTFNQSDGQGYFNKSKLTYRIMNNEGNKYVQFVLSAEPVAGQSVDVKMTSKGIKELSSSVTYKAMKVDRLEDNKVYLIGGADTKYTALILVWIE
ncbi:MAG: hypothetical protein J6K78_00580 [Tidjanibacter sp.]|nr:hypothetical protein [Tidjanibacter sp.]